MINNAFVFQPAPNGYLLVGSDQRRGEFRRIHDNGNTVIYLPSAHARAQEDVDARRVIITSAASAKLLDQLLLQRTAHSRDIVDRQRVHALRYA